MDVNEATIDLARGWSRVQVHCGGFLPALVCVTTLFSMQSQQVVSGGALLAVQGFDVQKICLDFPRDSYGKLARLAGGAVCVPQLGAYVLASLLVILPGRQGAHFMTPPWPAWALREVVEEDDPDC